MSTRPTITVAITRFDDLLALGLRAVLADDPSVSLVAHDVTYARIPATLRAHRPVVLILDSGALPDLAAVRALSVAHPTTRLVLLGDVTSAAESAQLLAFGASACLARDTQARDVRNAVHLASRGLQLMPIGGKEGGGHVLDPLLTHREGDVLVLLRQGRSNAQIALALQIGVETVRSHARSIYRKLGVASRRELIGLPAPRQAPPAVAPPSRARPRAARSGPRRPLHN
jgi:DNA-binding NarL/FixJ family response regulator